MSGSEPARGHRRRRGSLTDAVEVDSRTAYDAWADSYDRDDNPTVDAAREALATLLPDPEGLDVVELGCGTGGNLAQLRAARTLVGLDLSERMLARAREAVPEATLQAADLTAPLPLDDGCADRVVISLVIEHLETPAPVLAQAARLLRPGGRLVVIELHPDRRRSGKRAWFERDGVRVQPPSFPHTRAELLGAVEGAGLRVGRVLDGPRVLAVEGLA